MRVYDNKVLSMFLILGVVVVGFAGCAALKGTPQGQVQAIPEQTVVSPALLKKPLKFKGSGFAPKEMVVVDIVLLKGMTIMGLEEGENTVGIALAAADDKGNFEAATAPLATMQTLLQVPWVTTKTGTKPDFKGAKPFPPGEYTIVATGMDSGVRATSKLTVIPPAKK
jgi:hypothetical protein